jgi:hypothetical protein
MMGRPPALKSTSVTVNSIIKVTAMPAMIFSILLTNLIVFAKPPIAPPWRYDPVPVIELQDFDFEKKFTLELGKYI